MNNHLIMTLVADDGSKFELNADSVYLKPDITGLTELPTIRTSSGVNVGTDGGWTSAQFFDARLISIQGVIADSDIAKVEQKRRELNAMLAKKKLRLDFVTEAGNSYSVDVRVVASQMTLSQQFIAQEFKIDFRADDPLIYDNSTGGNIVATLTVQRLLGGFEIEFDVPFEITGSGSSTNVLNTGNSEVYPIITLKGPLHSPTIVNATTNQQFQISRDMVAEDVAIIDSKLQTVTLNGLDIFADKTEASQFITIAPGNNSMSLTTASSSDDGVAEIKFKSGYYAI